MLFVIKSRRKHNLKFQVYFSLTSISLWHFVELYFPSGGIIHVCLSQNSCKVHPSHDLLVSEKYYFHIKKIFFNYKPKQLRRWGKRPMLCIHYDNIWSFSMKISNEKIDVKQKNCGKPLMFYNRITNVWLINKHCALHENKTIDEMYVLLT